MSETTPDQGAAGGDAAKKTPRKRAPRKKAAAAAQTLEPTTASSEIHVPGSGAPGSEAAGKASSSASLGNVRDFDEPVAGSSRTSTYGRETHTAPSSLTWRWA